MTVAKKNQKKVLISPILYQTIHTPEPHKCYYSNKICGFCYFLLPKPSCNRAYNKNRLSTWCISFLFYGLMTLQKKNSLKKLVKIKPNSQVSDTKIHSRGATEVKFVYIFVRDIILIFSVFIQSSFDNFFFKLFSY